MKILVFSIFFSFTEFILQKFSPQFSNFNNVMKVWVL